MRIGDKVFVRIAHMTTEGVVVDINRDEYGIEYLVRVGEHTYWIPYADCTLLSALESWGSEPPTR